MDRDFHPKRPLAPQQTVAILRAMSRLQRILPPINSKAYHIFLGAIAILILGPLGGITAAYMNLALGFFVGGQVLSGGSRAWSSDSAVQPHPFSSRSEKGRRQWNGSPL